MYHLLSANGVVLRGQTGKLIVNVNNQLYIKKAVAYYLRQLTRAFLNGSRDGNCVEKADETHCVFNMDNGKKLGFVGDS